MKFETGNQFWKLRLKHGRDCEIATAEELWDNFCEYQQWVVDNPLIEIDFKGKDATKVELPRMRAMTKDAFALACGLSGWEIIDKYRKRGTDFNEIITRIERYIYQQKLEGSAAGFLNPNIIARDLGLRDNSDITSNNQKIDFKFVVDSKETGDKINDIVNGKA